MGYDNLPIRLRGMAPAPPVHLPGDPLAVRRSRAVSVTLVAAGVAVGLGTSVWAQQGESAARAAEAAGPDLGRMLMFMAALKAAAALGALLAVGWRLRFDVAPALAAGYAAGALAMAAAPGLIWSLAYVIAGAGLFHGGFLLLLVLACTDRGDGAVWRSWLPGPAKADHG